jgi:hypothetical protein
VSDASRRRSLLALAGAFVAAAAGALRYGVGGPSRSRIARGTTPGTRARSFDVGNGRRYYLREDLFEAGVLSHLRVGRAERRS